MLAIMASSIYIGIVKANDIVREKGVARPGNTSAIPGIGKTAVSSSRLLE